MKKLLVIALGIALCSCQRTPSEVADKVLADFGLKERPEGYVSGSDQVAERLAKVGETQMKRMNLKNRDGEVKFQDEGGLQGKYYKEVRVYEQARPLDAQPVSKGPTGERGYNGYIEYEYRIYQSERKSNRTEAAAAPADVPTDIRGRETYRYRFTPAGTWDGGEGEKVKR